MSDASFSRPEDPSVTFPVGFLAAATIAGIKASGKPDLGLISSEKPCTAAGTFTQNAFPAAPVVLSRERLRGGRAQAIVFNSGNANACTGKEGRSAADVMTEQAAQLLGISPDLVLAASTGVIGVPFPIDRVRASLPTLQPRRESGHEAAVAIMTTDTRSKESALAIRASRGELRIGAMAKGVGMIHPNMATMLAFLTTDAALDAAFAHAALKRVVDKTFNMVTVDGDTSTNDSCFLLANGMAGGPELRDGDQDALLFEQGLEMVCTELARMMARDGEGATKLIQVDVAGAASLDDARAAARAVVRSNLLKAAVYGQDPNWGRVFAAVGNSGAAVDPEMAALWIGDIQVARGGQGTGEDARPQLSADEVLLRIELGVGPESARAWGCDLTEQYVIENSAYTT